MSAVLVAVGAVALALLTTKSSTASTLLGTAQPPRVTFARASENAGLHFDHVSAVRYRRLDRRAPHALLHLVSIVSAPLSERFGIILSFQGGGEVFLEVDRLSGHMRDLDTAPDDPSPDHQ